MLETLAEHSGMADPAGVPGANAGYDRQYGDRMFEHAQMPASVFDVSQVEQQPRSRHARHQRRIDLRFQVRWWRTCA
jgi:hypothetical protein